MSAPRKPMKIKELASGEITVGWLSRSDVPRPMRKEPSKLAERIPKGRATILYLIKKRVSA